MTAPPTGPTTGLFYDDVDPSREYVTSARTVTAGDIERFATVSGDASAVHFDEEVAAGRAFAGRIAHGMLGLSAFTGLAAGLGLFEHTSLALLAIEEWRFTAPIYVGDTIHGVFTVHRRRTTTDGGRGIVERRCRVVKNDGRVVQHGVLVNLVRRRPALARGAAAGDAD